MSVAGLSAPEPPPRRTTSRRAGRLLAGTASVAAHLGVFLALMAAWKYQAPPPEPPPVTVALMPGLPLEPSPTPAPSAPAAAAKALPDKPPPVHNIVRPTPVPPDLQPLPAADKPVAMAELGESDIAGAGTAESGSGSGTGGGGACNMVRLIQNGLRKDGLVQTAVADAHRLAAPGGKAILVWNGDWVKNLSQDGKGLAAVREAILWEVGFAPAACRAQTVHGLVLVSLSDAPGVRLALGVPGEWRWSDVLKLHSAAG